MYEGASDRTETLGVAVCAALMQIPLIHLHVGETTGSIDEEVRRANTKLADFHLTTNEFTKNEILKLGEDPNQIKVIGCPSIELVREVKEKNLQVHFLTKKLRIMNLRKLVREICKAESSRAEDQSSKKLH